MFELTKPNDGILRIACDNRYTVRLNGRLVGMGSNWQQWDAFRVAELLTDGQNELIIRCFNDEPGPAGLAVQLSVTTADGTQDVVSSSQWQAKIQQDGTWDPSIEARTPWASVYSLGVVNDTAPWNGSGPIRTESEIRQIRARVAASPDSPFLLQDGDLVLWLGGTFI